MRKKILGLIFALMMPSVALLTACKHDHVSGETWKSSETHHWQECTKKKCDEKLFYDNHEYVDTTDKDIPATELQTGKDFKVCSVCGYETYDVIPVLEHTHTFMTTWEKDETYHWHKATCEHINEVKDKAEHDEQGVPLQADIDSTYSKVGTDFKKCSVCEYEWSEVIPLKPKTQPTVTLITTSKVYDAESVLLTSSDYDVSEGSGSVGLKWYVKGEEVPLAAPPTNAGTYEVEFVIAEGESKLAANIKKDFVIEKKSISGLQVESVYSGSAVIKVKDSDIGVLVSGLCAEDEIEFNLTFENRNVGAKLTSVEICETYEGLNYQIEKEAVVATLTKRELSNVELEFEYNGSLKFERELNSSNCENLVEDEKLIVEITTSSKEVGATYVSHILKDNGSFRAGNYLLEDAEVSATVIKKELAVVYDFEYAKSAAFVKEFTDSNLEGIASGEKISVTFTFETKSVGSDLTNVQISELFNYSNYSLAIEDVTAQIVKKVLTDVSVSDEYDSKDYRNVEIVTGNGLFEGDVVSARISLSSANVGSTATGVALEGIDAENYSLDLSEVSVEIIQKQNTIKVEENSVVLVLSNYTKELFLETAGVETAVSNDDLIIAFYNNAECTGDPITEKVIGVCYAKLSCVETTNYAADEEVITVNFKNEPSVLLKTTSKTYDGTPISLVDVTDYEISEGAGSVELRWYVKGEETPLATAPTNAGTYEVEFVIAEGVSQVAKNIKKEFVITAKTLTSIDLETVYDRNSTHTVKIVDGIIGDDEVYVNVSVLNSCGYNGYYSTELIEGENITEVSLSGAEAMNYSLDKSEVTLLVNKKKITSLSNIQLEYEYNKEKTFEIYISKNNSEDILETFGVFKIIITFADVNVGSEIESIQVDYTQDYPAGCYEIDINDLDLDGVFAIVKNTNPIYVDDSDITLSSLKYSSENIKTLAGFHTYAETLTEELYTSSNCDPATIVDGSPTNGTYYYKIMCEETENHVADYEVIKVVIAKQQANITVSTTSKQYDGVAATFVQGVDFVVTGGTGEITITWFASGSQTPLAEAPKDIGVYDVLIVVADSNENLETTKKVSYEITRIKITSIDVEFEFEYSGSKRMKTELTSEHSAEILGDDVVYITITFANVNVGSAVEKIEVNSITTAYYIDFADLEINGTIEIVKCTNAIHVENTEITLSVSNCKTYLIHAAAGFDGSKAPDDYEEGLFVDAECTEEISEKNVTAGVYYYKIWHNGSANIMADYAIITVTLTE